MKPIAIRFTASFRGFGQAMPVSPHPARKKNLGFVLPKCSYELRDKDRYRPEHARAAPLALRLCRLHQRSKEKLAAPTFPATSCRARSTGTVRCRRAPEPRRAIARIISSLLYLE